MVSIKPYRVRNSYSYDSEERPLPSPGTNEQGKKNSRLSELFNVQNNNEIEVQQLPTVTPPRTTPPTTIPSTPMPPSPPTPPTPPAPTDSAPKESSSGKGRGKKGASAFIKGSYTQQQIWKAQDSLEVLESFLADNSVNLFIYYPTNLSQF